MCVVWMYACFHVYTFVSLCTCSDAFHLTHPPVPDSVDRRCVCYIHSEIRLALFVLGVICFFLLICFVVAYTSLGSARAVVVLEKYMYGEGIFVSGIFVAGSLFVSGILLRQHWVRCLFLISLFFRAGCTL